MYAIRSYYGQSEAARRPRRELGCVERGLSRGASREREPGERCRRHTEDPERRPPRPAVARRADDADSEEQHALRKRMVRLV